MKTKSILSLLIVITVSLSSCKRRASGNLFDSYQTPIFIVGVPMEIHSGDTVYVILVRTPGWFEKGGTSYQYVPEAIEARTSRAILK